MIKLTNGQAGAFNSPIIQNMFQDPERKFPMADAFKLSDLIKTIQDRLKAYVDQMTTIVKANNGEITEQGMVKYGNPDDAKKAADEIAALNAIELEYVGEKITPGNDWPQLSLAEASILSPILNLSGKEDERV